MNRNRLIIFLLLCFFSGYNATAQQLWTSIANGNWSSSSTWSTSGGASGAPPSSLNSNQRVLITNGHTVIQTNDVVMDGSAWITINGGAKLQMGNASNPAPTFTMKNDNNRFFIEDAIYTSFIPGSGGNMLIEDGLVDWRGASIYISGNYIFKDPSEVIMINVCHRAAQNILFEGTGSSTNRSILNNVYHIAGVEGTGNFTIKASSFFDVSNIRIKVGSQSGYAEFESSSVQGSIFSIDANNNLITSSLSGSPSLAYWCSDVVTPNLNAFSGTKTNDCTIAQAQDCGPGILYSILGTVFRDDDAGTINGTGTGTACSQQLYASAIDGFGSIATTTSVNANGTYTLTNLGPGFYSVVLHTNPAGSTTANLPCGWENTAEGTLASGDGTPNGIIPQVNSTSSTPANFGIRPPQADLAILKTAPDTVNGGGSITYTLTLTNNGPGTAFDVLITDTLPASLTGATYTLNGTALGSWPASHAISISQLANGASAVVVITAGVPVSQCNPISNRAYVSASTPDPDLSNNRSTSVTTVVRDVTPPEITCPASPQTRNDNTGTSYTTSGTEFDNLSANDNCGPITISNNLNGASTLSSYVFPNGNTTVIWTVTDGAGNTATCSFIVDVNDKPVALDDTATTQKNTPKLINICANDTASADGGNVWSVLTQPVNGTVSIAPVCSLTYTPNPGFTGRDSLVYIVCDVDGDCDTAVVRIRVNDKPVALDDTATTQKNTPKLINICANDTASADGGNVWSVLTQPVNGTVSIAPVCSLTYTPNPGFTGRDSLVYIVCDVDGDCDTAVVRIRVNDVPVAVTDTASTPLGTPVTVNICTNDTVSSDGGNVWSIVNGPSNGTFSFTPPCNLVYTPDSTFIGNDTIRYVLCDTDGDCDTALVIIEVTCVNPAAPTLNITQPTCTTATATITITAPTGAGLTYSINGINYQSGTTFGGVSSGSYSVTVKNSAGCISAPTTAVVNAQPPTPAAPTVDITQPTCTTATATITITAPTGAGLTYSIDGSTYQAGTSFSGVATGTYSVTVKNSDGCISAPTTAVVNAQPPTPAAPTVNITQPTCTTATATITITAPTGAGLTYSIDGINYQSGTTFSGVATGTYSVTAKNSFGCISAPTTAVVNAQPPTPAVPTVTVVQPTCSTATGTITITAPTGAGLTYSINGITYQSGTVFNNVAPGTYNVTARNSAGCTSLARQVVVNPQPTSGCGVNAGLFPTSTSCSSFSNGTALPLSALCYTSKSNKVANVTPGVYFYWAFITAPSSSFTVEVEQISQTSGFKLFRIVQANQAFVFRTGCTRQAAGIEFSPGQARINVTGATPGAQYIVSIKYDSKSVIGSPSAGNPIANYRFVTKINGSVASGTDVTIPVRPNNCSGARLGGEAEEISLGTVYPNPTNDLARVTYNLSEAGEAQFILYNMNGQMVFSRTAGHDDAGEHSIDLYLRQEGLPEGMYLLQLLKGGEQRTVRILLQ